MDEKLSHVWDVAMRIDQPLVRWRLSGDVIARKYVKSRAFSRPALFTSLVREQPIVFSDMCIPIEGSDTNRQQALLDGIRNKIPRTVRVKVRAGQAETPVHLSARELVARWNRGRAILCVTDFHFKETRLENAVDLGPLSEFNLLAYGGGSMA